jgi:hypothetical protein
MSRTATGVFATYAAAGDAVRELELIGISGEQVEVVSDAGHDLRADGVTPAPRTDDPEKLMEGYTLVIVHPADDLGIEQAKGLMDRYGAEKIASESSNPGAPLKSGDVETTPDTSIGGPGTTGNDPTDLEGRGKQIKIHEVDTIPKKRKGRGAGSPK